MDSNEVFVLPPDIEWRLHKVYTQDLERQLKDVIQLVSLQETELALMWLGFIGLVTYVLVKEHRVE